MINKNILLVFGTRPEAIKLAPVFQSLSAVPQFNVKICVTGQHREMLDQVLDIFGITPEYDLDIMSRRQTLESITSAVLAGVGQVLDEFAADGVIVHGDTTTTMAASLAAFYRKIPVFHVEAGLRTSNIYSPWPEEANRRITDSITTLYFAPTEMAKNNLLRENIAPSRIYVTGNTVIDAVAMISDHLDQDIDFQQDVYSQLSMLDFTRKMVLITGHRRENFGRPFRNFCQALKTLAIRFPQVQFVYPVHLNPNVREPVNEILAGQANVFLLEPMEYRVFVYLMRQAFVIITDSGGIQEEAPYFSVPVLITRDTTERPEALAAGTARLVGTEHDSIVTKASQLLTDEALRKTMQAAKNPFGDGNASARIADALLGYFAVGLSETA